MATPVPSLKIPAVLDVVQIRFRDRDYRYPASIINSNEGKTTMADSHGGHAGGVGGLGKVIVGALGILLLLMLLCNLPCLTCRGTGFTGITVLNDTRVVKDSPSDCMVVPSSGHRNADGVEVFTLDPSRC